MRMLVVGAGSTGGYFGGRLVEAGRDVTFLVRPTRAARLRQDGLRLVSPHGDAILSPRLLTAGEIDAPYDAILLTVKAFSLEAALADMAPAVGPETVILPVLNGMRHVERLTNRFGAGSVAGCVCKVMTAVDDDGRIVQSAPVQELAYGEMDGAVSPRMERLDAFMRDAGFDARLSRSIEHEMWEKWVLLAALGAVNSLMRGTVGEIAAVPGGPAFVERSLHEIVAVAAACGRPMTDPFVTATRSMLTAPGSQQTSSMYRDLARGHAVEADQIIGDLVARGRTAGVETPLLAAAYANLLVYQARLSAKPG